jgi:hypothetical protein
MNLLYLTLHAGQDFSEFSKETGAWHKMMCMYLVCYIRLVRSAARRLPHRTTEETGGAVFSQYWLVSAYFRTLHPHAVREIRLFL